MHVKLKYNKIRAESQLEFMHNYNIIILKSTSKEKCNMVHFTKTDPSGVRRSKMNHITLTSYPSVKLK
ncbi:hypothetical protein AN2V17_02300 [Vallitalea sp. AN17-2]|uniref:Uncharacterized protein n=1 Tax=Vallitalea maricola TaxID=3074433 RepID=A0ACB5UDJ1_9FIRM|nr:hypothetical protein AN2V17_02300 [Vallitalea sp. AN17-2]